MAWRIDEHVIRGEIDNRKRGHVTGRIWFAGRDVPVELELAGNAWRDLAGRRLEFVNPDPKPGLSDSFVVGQRGVVGDITASRKVKVPEIPLDQIGDYYEQGRSWPWHWGNSLYLEWFSDRNGRVVIESASFQLTVSPDVSWDMTEAEELEQRTANAGALETFMERLAEAVGRASGVSSTDDADETPDDRPQTEEEAERMLADSEKLSDRIRARFEREGPEGDFERILDEELERRREERGEQPLTPEQEAERAAWIEEASRAAEESADDPELREIVERRHPLAERAFALAGRIADEPEERGWIGAETQREHPVVELVGAVMCASGKLAGALNGREWPPDVDDCGLTIAWLKRARGFIDDALAAARVCAEDKLTDPAWLAGIHAEITELAAAVDTLIAELRARLERGFD